jgi:hypothetical protein
VGTILRARRDGPNRLSVLYLGARHHGRSARRQRRARRVVVVARSKRRATPAPELAAEPIWSSNVTELGENVGPASAGVAPGAGSIGAPWQTLPGQFAQMRVGEPSVGA